MTRTKKIFVGGLSVNTTIEDVKQYFDQFGKVSFYKHAVFRPQSGVILHGGKHLNGIQACFIFPSLLHFLLLYFFIIRVEELMLYPSVICTK